MIEHDGGPAFPSKANPGTYQVSHYGMTLRDYFAAKAMQGVLASPLHASTETAKQMAEASYIMADAMLEQRNKK